MFLHSEHQSLLTLAPIIHDCSISFTPQLTLSFGTLYDKLPVLIHLFLYLLLGSLFLRSRPARALYVFSCVSLNFRTLWTQTSLCSPSACLFIQNPLTGAEQVNRQTTGCERWTFSRSQQFWLLVLILPDMPQIHSNVWGLWDHCKVNTMSECVWRRGKLGCTQISEQQNLNDLQLLLLLKYSSTQRHVLSVLLLNPGPQASTRNTPVPWTTRH